MVTTKFAVMKANFDQLDVRRSCPKSENLASGTRRVRVGVSRDKLYLREGEGFSRNQGAEEEEDSDRANGLQFDQRHFYSVCVLTSGRRTKQMEI